MYIFTESQPFYKAKWKNPIKKVYHHASRVEVELFRWKSRGTISHLSWGLTAIVIWPPAGDGYLSIRITELSNAFLLWTWSVIQASSVQNTEGSLCEMRFNVVYFPRIIIFTNLVNNNRITANVGFNHSLFTQTTVCFKQGLKCR